MRAGPAPTRQSQEAEGGKVGLAEEIRGIRRRISSAEYRDFVIDQEWAIRRNDLVSVLQYHRPDIVHFSGHGTKVGEIILEDDAGRSAPVAADVLAEIFRVLSGDVRCVVLNACYSHYQAEGIGRVVDSVIGMERTVLDEAAIQFSGTFYEALANGRTVRDSFDLGQAAMRLVDPNQTSARLLAKNSDAEKARLIYKPELCCEFRTNPRGNPVSDDDTFEVRAFIRNPPKDTFLVVYQLDEYHGRDEFCKVGPDQREFELYFDCPFDFEIRATLWCAQEGGIGLRFQVCDALERFYEGNSKPAFRRAIRTIRDSID